MSPNLRPRWVILEVVQWSEGLYRAELGEPESGELVIASYSVHAKDELDAYRKTCEFLGLLL